MLKVMPKYNQKGVIPLVALIITGVIAVVGGSYIIRNDLLNTNGQKSTPAPKLTPIQSGLADKPFTYNPPQNTSSNTQTSKEPAFTITPPAGWVVDTSDDSGYVKFIRAGFVAPEQDKIEIDPVTKAFMRLPASVKVLIVPADHNLQLQELIDVANEDVRKTGITRISSKEITIGGIRGYSQELKIPFKNVILTKNVTGTNKEEKGSLKESAFRHQIDYIFAIDNFSVYIIGSALEQAWGNRAGEIKASMNSFAFKEVIKE